MLMYCIIVLYYCIVLMYCIVLVYCRSNISQWLRMMTWLVLNFFYNFRFDSPN